MKAIPRGLLVLDIVAALALVAASVMVFAYAPVERVMGMVKGNHKHE